MSKLYHKFLELKTSNSDKLYLFKSGIFYLALNEDATKLAEIFNFKITNLNDTVTKCGFPEKRIDYYSVLLEKLHIDFEIIDSGSAKSNASCDISDFQDVVDQLVQIDFDNITFRQAFDTLYMISEETKKIVGRNGTV